MFNWSPAMPIARSRVSVGSKGKGGMDEDTFVDDYWQDEVLSAYEDIKSNPSLNAGQQAILEQNEEEITSYLFEVGSDYNPDDFDEYLQSILDGGKYDALSETFENYAKELEDSWDHATGGDGSGAKKFLGVIYD